MKWYVGLMSGTSVDGVDGVLMSFDDMGRPIRTAATASLSFDPELVRAIHRLQHPGDDELAIAAWVANALAEAYARCVAKLLQTVPASDVLSSMPTLRDIVAVGAHGQTVRHRPDQGYTLQLLNGALLAEKTGIDVVCDLRSADVAASGQGAPLLPAFHAEVFGSGRSTECRAILNLGGISNVTILDPRQPPIGFDCGPANTLIDAWAREHLNAPFDDGGRWAASGRVNSALLESMMSDPYFTLPPPKSSGRDLFHPQWLDHHLKAFHPAPRPAPSRQPVRSCKQSSSRVGSPSSGGAQAECFVSEAASETITAEDVQATLVELSCQCIATAIAPYKVQNMYACGGGVNNEYLMARLSALTHMPVQDTHALGVDPQFVEASGFAWLAMRRCTGHPGNLPSVTGAHGARILGALHAAPAGHVQRAAASLPTCRNSAVE